MTTPLQRRTFLQAISMGIATTIAERSAKAQSVATAGNTELAFMPATELVAAIQARQVSPVEVVEAALRRIETLNPTLNAYCTVAAESAVEAAKQAERAVTTGNKLGPLHGVPVAVKDIVFTKGIRTTGGSKVYENFVPNEDEVIVERLKAAGAIILGKTNLSEFGYKGVTYNKVFGETVSPWNVARTPGGSSGGSGAAVAAGLGQLAVGQDGGGSIRIPASFCGLYGLKPSFGRVPLYPSCRTSEFPGFSGWETLEHTGPITRTVRDAALMLDVMAGHDTRDRHSLPSENVSYLEEVEGGIDGLRVAWTPDWGYAVVDPVVRDATLRAVRVFEELGCVVEEADPGFENPREAFATIVLLDTDLRRMRELIADWGEQMDPDLVSFMAQNRTLEQCTDARFVRQDIYNKMRSLFDRYDLLITPTMAVPPFELGISDVTEIDGRDASSTGSSPFTFPINFTGQPAASVPCGWTEDGLPIGLQIVGRPLDDSTVLRASAAFEAAVPWASRRPPVS